MDFKKATSARPWLPVVGGISTMICAGFLLNCSDVSAANRINGEEEFRKHCAACHANGGNIIKADKTLSRQDREKHGIKTAGDIVKLMRKPGMGMTTFDKNTVSDKEARGIADYIIKTFK